MRNRIDQGPPRPGRRPSCSPYAIQLLLDPAQAEPVALLVDGQPLGRLRSVRVSAEVDDDGVAHQELSIEIYDGSSPSMEGLVDHLHDLAQTHAGFTVHVDVVPCTVDSSNRRPEEEARDDAPADP